MNSAEKMVEFLKGCHSVFHATALMREQLESLGYTRLAESRKWELKKGGKYFVTRNDTSIIAFQIPKRSAIKSVNIAASHSDSPTFKIKPVADFKDPNYGRLNVETYGGAILSTWLDRPLSIAGRVIVNRDGRLVSELVDLDDNTAIIPNVAIHQNRTANEGYKWNPQVDLVPMIGLDAKENRLVEKLAAKLNAKKEEIVSYDLFMYNRTEPCVWGDEGEFISSPRLDDLECAYTSLQGFVQGKSRQSLNICAVFDNEEVGSMSRQGMGSTFLQEVLNRVFEAFGLTNSGISQIMANSFMISADNAHAVHPNHPELYDQLNRAYMNKGIVIKRNAAQSYVTDAVSEAVMKQLCQNSETPYQYFTNRSDLRGGGTQAAMAASHIASMAVDIGLPQLAMHSSYETGGSKDVEYMINVFTEFFSSSIAVEDGEISITK